MSKHLGPDGNQRHVTPAQWRTFFRAIGYIVNTEPGNPPERSPRLYRGAHDPTGNQPTWAVISAV
jgi:hypothetical protein